MLKSILGYILLVSCMLQSFQQAAFLGSYYSNQKAYAKNCINKSKPQLHCNGRCQLMKKMKAEEKKEQQEPTRINKTEALSSKSFYATLPALLISGMLIYPIFIDGNPVAHSASFFHPPPAIFLS